METLKSAIKKAVVSAGVEKALKQESAVFLWGEVVGKRISSVTTAEKVDKGVLTVKTESPTWRQELHMQKKEIIDKINNKIGSKTIKEIRFI
jgi:predicted nucleic acid-binding Zn ribbon protein|tara:strand:- start:393 stop:668 length:276 start_codon:yes stop_codon:yes gene_type:complete